MQLSSPDLFRFPLEILPSFRCLSCWALAPHPTPVHSDDLMPPSGEATPHPPSPPSFLLYFRWGGFTKRKTIHLNIPSCSPYPRLGTGEKVFEMKEVGWSLLEGEGICTLEAEEVSWGQSPAWCIVR